MVRLVGQRSDWTIWARHGGPRWRATSRSPVRTIFAKALRQFISRQALASNPSLVAAARRSVEVRSQRRFGRPVRGRLCVNGEPHGACRSRFLKAPPPKRRRPLGLSPRGAVWGVRLPAGLSDHRWTRLLNDLRGPAGAGTVQVTCHVDAAGTDCGGAVRATNITRRRVADTDPSRFLVCSSRVNFRSQIV